MANDGNPLDELQSLLLLKLLFTGEEPKLSAVKPDPGKKRRDQLKDLGLIEYEKRDHRDKRGRKIWATHIVPTDEAWLWAARHLDARISLRSTYSGHALSALLIKLKTYMEQNDVALADLLAASNTGTGAAETTDIPANLESRIRDAYRTITNGEWNVRVRLADLRPKFPEVPRTELDDTLLRMQRDGKLVLYTNDDPLDLTPADHEAALHVLGAHRHLVYMGNA